MQWLFSICCPKIDVRWNANEQRFMWKERQERERGGVYLQMASRLWDTDGSRVPPPESSWFHSHGAKRWPHHFCKLFFYVATFHLLQRQKQYLKKGWCLQRKTDNLKIKLYEFLTIMTSENVLAKNCFVMYRLFYLSWKICTFLP